MRLNQSIAFLFLFSLHCGLLSAAEFNGFARLAWAHSDTDQPWLQSWLRDGTGVTRYDHINDGFDIGQIAFDATFDVLDTTSLHLTSIYYPDGEDHLGITELYLQYKPLSPGWQNQWRFGAFYPKMSLENPDIAWNSPYTYSFSAINSWIAEELKVVGAEWQIKRPGRKYRSPHSYTFLASAYVGNDPFGTMLSWRGWALHDRQTLLGERVQFANYPSLQPIVSSQPSWVEPIAEIDDKVGVYVGAHWQYKNTSDVRLYYYNNYAEETAREENLGQYAWHTDFISLAWQYRFNNHHRLLLQLMEGRTKMGEVPIFADPNGISPSTLLKSKNIQAGHLNHDDAFGFSPVVDVKFSAWYAMYSYKIDQHRVSIRYDDFKTTDEDQFSVEDPNASNGHAWTLAWKYSYDENYQIGIEFLEVTSWNDNRWLWQWPREERQQQIQLVIDYRF